MKTKRILYRSVLPFTALALTWGALGMYSQTSSTEFRVDRAKPFAYLELDHIGPRPPLIIGEPHTGIWLRFRNNSTMPIVVGEVTDPRHGSTTLGLVDEVVPDSLITLGSGRIHRVSPGFQEATGMDDLFQFPNEEEGAVRAAEWNDQVRLRNGQVEAAMIRPHGYSWEGLSVLTIIPAGGTLLFSLPINHVSKTWHVEVPFRFALETDGKTRPPYSYLAFFWDDLPEVYRTVKTESPKLKPDLSANTLLHESGHVDPSKPH